MLTQRCEFVPASDSEIFAATPAAPAVFLLRADDPQSQPYVSKTANLRRRLQRLLGAHLEHSRKLNLRERIRWIEYSPTGSDFESGFLLYKVLRSTFPETYADRLRFRFAPLVKLHMENEYPRASITMRLGRLGGHALYYGPFVSRTAAEKFANDSLDFFKMRRCVDDLHPDPAFPGCIYSEMKMCLAPCFKGCTDEQYRTEVARVQAYFDTGGESLLREVSSERDQASANLEFENAATLHARIEKLKPILSQLPEIVHRIDRLAGVLVQPSAIQPNAATESVVFFRLDAGSISAPLAFALRSPEHAKSQSMESRIHEALTNHPPAVAGTAVESMEHLAILKRWYYRSSRVGEIFFADEKGVLPMRRLVRGISRVFRGEKPDPEPMASQPPPALS
ncbi:MAG: UvrB/UvrC motif-containing protein [Terriglobales bacterium]